MDDLVTLTGRPPASLRPCTELEGFQTAAAGGFTYRFVATPLKSGKIALKSTKKVKLGQKKRRIKLATKAFTAPANATVKVKHKLSKKARKALKRAKKLRFKVTATLAGKTYTTNLTLKAPKKR